MQILTVNAGSSSVRLGLYRDGKTVRATSFKSVAQDQAEKLLAEFIGQDEIDAAGHRVVHGGAEFSGPALITAQALQAIERAGKLAPLHNPIALHWIATAKAKFPKISQVAVFDTAYFSTLPELAKEYGLPHEVTKQYGIRRYGFHGIAHECMCRATAKLGVSKLITLQLGSGCSMAAIKDGEPVDTSMGFTPLEGLLMATRAGDVDPGTLLYLLREQRLETNALATMLNEKSGLLGVSGESGDMQHLLSSTSAGAKKAVELFCYRVRKYLGAFASVLGGVDAIVFGGGIGENSPQIREKILCGAAYLGVEVDEAQNQALIGKEGLFQTADAKVKLLVVNVDEGKLIAEKTQGLLQ